MAERAPTRTERQLLLALARGGPQGWGRLLDAQDATIAEFHAALDDLRARGLIATTPDGSTALTDAGRRHVDATLGAPASASDLRCAPCEGRGYAPDAALLARLERLLVGRPAAELAYDQGAVTAADALARAGFLHERGDLQGCSILLVGDFDLLSLALATVARPARLVVLDIDTRVLEFVTAIARREGLPIEARPFDVRDPLPADLAGRFDAFVTDPVETLAGIRLYLSRGAAALRGEGGAAYVGLTSIEASRRKWYEIQRELHAMGFVVTDARRRFSSYPDHDAAPETPGYTYPVIEALGARGVEHRWYTSSFLRAEAVRAPEPAVTGHVDLGDALYVDDEAWATPRANGPAP